jgi:chromosome segregation protein
MRLSQIKIAGFKSFVDPTTIGFPTNITAIVGPNGCGKSNVIDAVRWVMGESSAKNLRGDSMEDVIFSGSSTRKPVGQASVELIFDNSSGRVTGEYAKYNEISVKRLATRAGQSRYFLNNTHCRRRDIADIFLGTGLGPRSYSIIEQGMVSRIIDARPEELRVYLEEAAGISKYKERRRETETRIRHTRENLDRLNDLIEEIDSQLLRLERQSKTAEKYKLLKHEQRKIEAQSLLLQKLSFDKDIERQTQKLNTVETETQKELGRLRSVEKEIEESRQKLVEATDQHNQIQSQYYQLGSEISTREQSIEHQQNLRQHNSQELQNVQRSLLESEQTKDIDGQNLAKLESGLTLIRPKLEAMMNELAVREETATRTEFEMNTWQENWDLFNSDFHQIHESAQIESRSIQHIETQVQQVEQRRNRLQQELEGLDTSSYSQAIKTLENQAEAKDQEQQATLEQAQTRADEIQNLRGLIDSQSTLLDQKRSEVQTLKGRLSSLEALQQHVLAEKNDAIREWLENNQIDSSQRLTEIIKVNNNLEKAAEVVLGPFLSAYCVAPGHSLPDAQVPRHNIALFERQQGQGSSRQQRDWPCLLDSIDCEIDLSALLSGIYLCQDTQELVQRRPLLKDGESLVTAAGLWAGQNWLLQLGDEDQRSGMLSRKQEITSLRKQLDKITASTTALKSRIDGDRERLRQNEQLWEEDQRALNVLHNDVSDIRNQLSQRKGYVEQVQSRYTQLQQELEELDQVQKKHRSELAINSGKRDQFLQQIELESANKSTQLANKEALQQNLMTTRSALQEYRETYHQLQMRSQLLESELESTQSNIERVNQQNEQFERRIIELSGAVEGALEPIASLQKSLQTLLETRNQNQQNLGESQDAVTQLDNQQRELEAQRNHLQQSLDELRNQLEGERMQKQELVIRGKTVDEQLQKSGFDSEELTAEIDSKADADEWQSRLEALNRKIDRLGPINLVAIDEHKEQSERKDYLDAQNEDLVSALATLESAIHKIDKETKARFKETFDHVNRRIADRFPKLFGGGEARLELTENNLLDTGVMIMARPPGKRITNLQLLSGGEKALTAVALIFSIFELNPSPFCMLDEVDAPLDDANVGRFCAMVEEMSEQVQFIMISHNKITIEMAINLNGVTMHEPGVSRLVSVDVGEAVELAEA